MFFKYIKVGFVRRMTDSVPQNDAPPCESALVKRSGIRNLVRITLFGANLFSVGILCAISVFCPSLFAQNKEDIEKFIKIIYTLSDDSMQGRAAGSQGEEKAKNYLLKYFKELGLTNTKIQEFIFPKDSLNTAAAYNLISYIDNKSDSTIIIGAHYDHLGFGGPKSRSLTKKKIHPGADDNASGVAMMLMLAEYFSSPSGSLPAVGRAGRGTFNYLFIAFSAHEDGLFGSQKFVEEKKYLSKVKLILNFDMVGRLDTVSPILRIVRREKDNYLDSMLIQTKPETIQLRITEDNINHTDAASFIKNNIPAITFSTGTHDDYHKVSDDAEKINYAGEIELYKYMLRFLARLN